MSAPSPVPIEPRPTVWPALGPLEVHAWAVDLREPGDELILSERERARAQRFFRAEHGRRFAAAHSAMRQILAGYAGCSPAELEYRTGEHGKPHLAASEHLQFNLSHSGDRALVGVATAGAVGVDIECHRQLTDRDALADRYFSPAEGQALRALGDAQRTAAFFRIWSRKEAFIKCIGRGLTQALDSFDVTLDVGDARLLAVRDPDLASARFEFWDLDVGPSAGAAVALRGRATRLRAWRWSHAAGIP